MKLIETAKIHTGQDGAIWGDLLFRFDSKGVCRVYDASPLAEAETCVGNLTQLASFQMGEGEPFIPHFNAVMFGVEYAADGDEFPLLYANIYNNYAKAEDRHEGTVCAYRVERDGESFKMTLMQVISVGFVKDALWCSDADVQDVRPYGNFVIDVPKKLLHAFTMRDKDQTTRYFTFRLPSLADGAADAKGVRYVVLQKEDIVSYFDTPYHNFIQGACCYGGLIYSTEGFSLQHTSTAPPAIRIVDPAQQTQLAHVRLPEFGLTLEAEWIDFYKGKCYYSDCDGHIYRAQFDL